MPDVTEEVFAAGVQAGMEYAARLARAAFGEKMNVGPMWLYHRNVEHDIRDAMPTAGAKIAETRNKYSMTEG